MGALSTKLRGLEGGRLAFWCPGCHHIHAVAVGPGSGPRWMWDGDVNLPTLTPSIHVRGVRDDMDAATQAAYDELKPEEMRGALDDPRFRHICHSYVTGGRIQFLNDCTHHLAGKTVDLPVHWPAP